MFSDSPKRSPLNQPSRSRGVSQREGPGKESTPKHDIVVVADGKEIIKGLYCIVNFRKAEMFAVIIIKLK